MKKRLAGSAVLASAFALASCGQPVEATPDVTPTSVPSESVAPAATGAALTGADLSNVVATGSISSSGATTTGASVPAGSFSTGTALPLVPHRRPVPATKTGVTVPAATGAVSATGASAVPPAAPAAVTRTGTVGYEAPSGQEQVSLTLTVDKGVITAASAQVLAQDGVSARYQRSFAAALPGAVVGQSIKSLDVQAIGGASLTTGAFAQFARTF